MHKLILLLLFALKIFSAEDIVYATVNGKRLMATLYKADSKTKSPCVVLLHEGGFRRGSRECFVDIGNDLALRGISALSVSYRLVQEGGAYPEAVKDCIEAVYWLMKNGSKYNIDTSRIGVWGNSAGAYLAVMVSIAGGLPEDIKKGHGQFKFDKPRVKAVISSLGFYDWEKSKFRGDGFIKVNSHYAEASPIRYAESSDADYFLIAAGNDEFFSTDQAKSFSAAVKANGRQVELNIKQWQKHAGICDMTGEFAQWVIPLSVDFLTRKLLRGAK
ncbi:MAG: alpha/beta hydrolase [Fibrobacteres bacterium]|nr:alpha/beta hydrolase [Fibrobacterota bacterium]